MRKLLILFIAASLFTACNNDKKDSRRSSDRDREKDDYRSRDDDKGDTRNADYKDDKDSRDREDTRNTDDGGGWSRSEENKFVDDCVAEAEKNVGGSRASEYCDCMLGKLKRMYSSYKEAERELANITQDEVTQLAADCNK